MVVLHLDPDCGYSQYPDAGREGGKSSSKIVGGWESRIHEFPYQVGVPTADAAWISTMMQLSLITLKISTERT